MYFIHLLFFNVNLDFQPLLSIQIHRFKITTKNFNVHLKHNRDEVDTISCFDEALSLNVFQFI
jgi:hypothetical protein